MTVVALLQERERTHGDFQTNAAYSQSIKDIVHGSEAWGKMPAAQREAMEMIVLKMSRILSGQTKFRDHWLDISGYAMLAAEACD